MKGNISLVLPTPRLILQDESEQHHPMTSMYNRPTLAPIDQGNVKQEGTNDWRLNDSDHRIFNEYASKRSIMLKHDNSYSPTVSQNSDAKAKIETEDVSNKAYGDENQYVLDNNNLEKNIFNDIDDIISYLTDHIKQEN